LLPVHQPVGGFANGFQPAQAVGERRRHLLRARAVRTRRLRQQQARFQEGEPGRHHEIIGGKLEPDLSRGFDEVEILVGERQDRDLGEIDLLLPRQCEQQVERPLVALDVHHQRRLTLGEFCGPPGFKR
jgi:hypothetical protein